MIFNYFWVYCRKNLNDPFFIILHSEEIILISKLKINIYLNFAKYYRSED